MKLSQNNKVIFAELPGTDLHRYYLTKCKGGKPVEMVGVTTMMKRLGLSADYSHINPDVLSRAAARGTAIHEMLQDYEMNGSAISRIFFSWICKDGDVGMEEEDCSKMLKAYAAISSANFKPLAVEYLVSDNKCVASLVDFISQVDDTTVDLIDYKSSSTLDKKGLSWQLSFYKYLFERQNKGIKVRNLYGVHCHNEKVKLVDVAYMGDDAVARALESFRSGKVAEPEMTQALAVRTLAEILPAYPELTLVLEKKRALQEMIDCIDDEWSEVIGELKDVMGREHISEVSVPGGRYVYTAEHTTVRFNANKFKVDHPELYDKYATPSTTSASLKFYKAK